MNFQPQTTGDLANQLLALHITHGKQDSLQPLPGNSKKDIGLVLAGRFGHMDRRASITFGDPGVMPRRHVTSPQ